MMILKNLLKINWINIGGIEIKVIDLISQLKNFNPNANVGVKTIDDLYEDNLSISYICKDNGGKDLTEKETEQIWIEAIDFCCNCQFFDNNNCLIYDCDVSDVEECYQFVEIGDGIYD